MLGHMGAIDAHIDVSTSLLKLSVLVLVLALPFIFRDKIMAKMLAPPSKTLYVELDDSES